MCSVTNEFNNIFKNNKIYMKNEIHKVHNYIRDFTKISNEDKAFFIAIILISIGKTSFQYIFDKYKNKNYIYDILLDNLTDYDIDIQVFKFLKTDENNVHLYNLIDMIYNIYNKNPSIDLLNEFYSEFVKYNNSDGKKLGIVLTPPHIVQLMSQILNINENDIVLDLCTGTGSFLLEANKYNPKKLIGCEYQNKLYALLKCNMILRNIKNYEIIKGDCFTNEFKATKSLINPPYGMKDKKEIDFIMKQLESLEDGGECCAIIPVSQINNKNNQKLLLKKCNIKTIIICRDTIFYPYANIGACIIHLEKNKNGNEILTSILNYKDDGYIVERHRGLRKTNNYDINYNNLMKNINNNLSVIGKNNKIKLELNTTWSILYKNNDNFDIQDIILNIELTKLELEYIKQKNNLLNKIPTNNNDEIKYKEFKIKDLFTILIKPDIEYRNFKNKYVHLITAKNNNQGISDLITPNKCTFYGNKLIVVTSGNGGAGLCFYQELDFNIKSAVKVLNPLPSFKLNKQIGIYIQVLLSKNKELYNRSNTWKNEDIYNTIIKLPVKNNNCINYDFLN